jgi:branched-chain amino acid transport system ATP-binding protein
VTTLLAADAIGISFGGVKALTEVSFEVAEGEVVGLIGPNGAGKTTLLNVISGLYRPSHGRLAYGAADITGMKPHRIAKLGVARTFQIVQPFQHLSVRDNVAIGALFAGERPPSRQEALGRAEAALARVGLAAKADRRPRQLTLSERKRLEFARALAMAPRLLLLDEVMAGLNHTEIDGIIALIHEINAAGMTIIVVEHVMKAIMAVCHRIVVLQFGRKIADAAPDRVVDDPQVISAYLGHRFAERHRRQADARSPS